MKKILMVIISCLGVLILISCTKETIPSTDSIESTENSESTIISSDVDSTTNYEPRFTSLTLDYDNIYQNETFIITINDSKGEITDDFINPYDSSEARFDAYFVHEDGTTYYRPAYWTVDFKIKLNTLSSSDTYYYDDELKGTDSAVRNGIGHFNVSFKPPKAGKYNLRIEGLIKGQNELLNTTFTAKESRIDYKGKIVINDTNKRYFMYENTKETYIPVGMNNAWYSSYSRKSFDYDEWFKRMADSNANWSRIWMASWSFGLHIGTGAKVNDFSLRLNQAARLERVLEVAEKEGIYLYLTMINHGQFSTNINTEWDINPYKELIDKPYKFWTDEECIRIYKDEIRYIVARYGTYDSLMAYELFNEVDWTESSSLFTNKIKDWHDIMAKYINSIDCYDRLVTTSYKGTLGSAMSLDSIDIANVHTYEFSKSSPFSGVKNLIDINYRNYNKIMLIAEWGVNASSGAETYSVDPTGITLYQSMWSSILQGASGTAMTWWWDQYIHRYKLYDLYKGVGEFAKRMDLNGELTYLNTNSVTISSSGLSFLAIKADDRTYGYLFDSLYSRTNKTINSFNTNLVMEYSNGNYELTLLNPKTGEVVKEENITVTNNTLTINTGEFNTDLAIIIK